MHPFYFTVILTIAYFQRQLLYLGDKSRESEAAAADLTEQEKSDAFLWVFIRNECFNSPNALLSEEVWLEGFHFSSGFRY